MYRWDWNVVIQYKSVFIQGALTTLWLTLLVVVFGTLLGLAVGLMRRSRIPLFPAIAIVYTELFRALPLLVLLIWLYYVSPVVAGVQFSPFNTALIALSVHLSAFVAETFRAAVESIPKNQFESGLTLGLTRSQTMFFVIMPQAAKNMLPNLLGHYVAQLKNSSLASVIGVNELLHRSNSVIASSYRPLEIYTAIAVSYLVIILPFTFLAAVLEKRLTQQTKAV